MVNFFPVINKDDYFKEQLIVWHIYGKFFSQLYLHESGDITGR